MHKLHYFLHFTRVQSGMFIARLYRVDKLCFQNQSWWIWMLAKCISLIYMRKIIFRLIISYTRLDLLCLVSQICLFFCSILLNFVFKTLEKSVWYLTAVFILDIHRIYIKYFQNGILSLGSLRQTNSHCGNCLLCLISVFDTYYFISSVTYTSCFHLCPR